MAPALRDRTIHSWTSYRTIRPTLRRWPATWAALPAAGVARLRPGSSGDPPRRGQLDRCRAGGRSRQSQEFSTLQNSFALCGRLILHPGAELPVSGNDHFRWARRGGPRRARRTAVPSNPGVDELRRSWARQPLAYAGADPSATREEVRRSWAIPRGPRTCRHPKLPALSDQREEACMQPRLQAWAPLLDDPAAWFSKGPCCGPQHDTASSGHYIILQRARTPGIGLAALEDSIASLGSPLCFGR